MSPRSTPTRRRNRAALAFGALACVVLSCACSTSEGDASPAVLATTTVWADVVSRVACGEEVPALVPPGTDAHSYEPSIRDADRLRAARVVVANGLDLEDGLTDALRTAAADGVTILEVADHTEVIDGDPHLWMDPDRVAAAVPAIADALGDAGLDLGPDELDRCAGEYSAELSRLAEEVESAFAAVPPARRVVVTQHENLRYFATRFGLDVVGAVVPSTSSLAATGPRAMEELEAAMRERDVRTVLVEADTIASEAEALADRVGATVVELRVESLAASGEPSSYVELVRRDAELIVEALAGGAP